MAVGQGGVMAHIFHPLEILLEVEKLLGIWEYKTCDYNVALKNDEFFFSKWVETLF